MIDGAVGSVWVLRAGEMQQEDVITIIALMLGPAIAIAFGLWCALYRWA
jgi:hypothetical protein